MIATTTILAVLAVAAAAAAGTGAYMSAQAQSDAAKYNAVVANNSATAATQQAQFDAQQIRDRNRRVLAQQKTAFAANGIDPTSGSATDVRADSAQQGEMQALMAIYTGRTSATASEAQARLDRLQSSNAQTAGYIGVASSLLQGGTNAGMIYANPNFR